MRLKAAKQEAGGEAAADGKEEEEEEEEEEACCVCLEARAAFSAYQNKTHPQKQWRGSSG